MKKEFIPKNVVKNQVDALATLGALIEKHINHIPAGWKIYLVLQTRGRCYNAVKTITIPIFAFFKETGYLEYYLCHEMAHAVSDASAHHGPEFMENFKKICPPHLQHYELDFKPRNASRAGIRRLGARE